MGNALVVALQMEEEGRRFYLRSAEKAKDPQSKKWFNALAEDENRHIRIVREIAGALNNTGKWPDLPADVNADMVQRLGRFFLHPGENVVAALKGDIGLKQTLEMGMSNETKSFEFYRELAGGTKNMMEKDFYRALMAEENNHFEILQNINEFLFKTGDWFSDEEGKTWNWMNI